VRSVGIVSRGAILEADGVEEEKATGAAQADIGTSAAETILRRTRSANPIDYSGASLGTSADALTIVEVIRPDTGSAVGSRSARGAVSWTGNASSCLGEHL
jgi:hypothetical protein